MSDLYTQYLISRLAASNRALADMIEVAIDKVGAEAIKADPDWMEAFGKSLMVMRDIKSEARFSCTQPKEA